MATIWDADILIWAAGTINRMQNQGDKLGLAELDKTRTIQFHPTDLLRAIKRGTGGRDLQELRAALRRLNSTYVETNVRQHHQRGRQGFNWIDSWSEVTTIDSNEQERVVGFTITLSHWFYHGVIHQRLLLSMEPEYFKLTGGYERWLYRVARKHAHGAPDGWSFSLSSLHQKSGSDATKRKFRELFKRIADKGGILGYRVEWQERGRGVDPLIRVYPDMKNDRNQKLAKVHTQKNTTIAAIKEFEKNPNVLNELISSQAAYRIKLEFPNVDLEKMITKFITWNAKRRVQLRDPARAFEGFVRRHLQTNECP